MLCKAGVPTGDFVVQVIRNKTRFQIFPDILLCRGKIIFVVVEKRRLPCWLCGTTSHLAKICPGQKPMPQPATPKEVVVKVKPTEVLDSPGEWREVIKKGFESHCPFSLTPEGCSAQNGTITEAVGRG